jgi:cysteine-rich repeat protein
MATSRCVVGRRVSLILLALSLSLHLGAGRADAQDVQKVRLGVGVVSLADCISAGVNGDLDSATGGDDQVSGTKIRAGLNGICESTVALGSDDVQQIPSGQGEPNKGVVRTDYPDGICDDVIVPGGDDVLLIPAGQGLSLMVGITTGPDDALDATPAGDDIAAGVICATADNSLETSVDPADMSVSRLLSPLCLALCQDNSNCIIPGPDGTLQSTAAPTDHLEPFVSTGFNGIAESTAIDDDVQFTLVGNGFITPTANPNTVRGEICVDSGANGIAETTICGNSVRDAIENPTLGGVGECDDGDTVAGDGCDATCGVEPGWTCPGHPSVCVPICGDGQSVDGEACDDGNTSNADGCLNVAGICTAAICGDGVRKTGGPGANELCDDGNLVNGDGCDNNCTVSGCPNGVVNGGEQCDDNNATNGDGCDANCTFTGCGNAVKTAGEACDDGNASNLDACLDTCVLNACGDGFALAGTEGCDDGNGVNGDGCDTNCTVTACNNGIVTAGEPCDDGNAVNTDACTTTCTLATCGDGYRKSSGGGPNEQCDDGNLTSGDGCDANCTDTRCGNGIAAAPETCDDANNANGDGCDNNCTATGCGNGIKTSGETCDDGNVANDDNCLNTCLAASCGDTFIHVAGTPPFETCDDGNVASGDGCDANCTPTGCPNGVVTVGETCDDGDVVDGDGCDTNCTPSACGNGVVAPNETCDDSNVVDGDGCDANCTPTGCGNGVVTSGEACDDGNSKNDDACVVGCVVARCGDSFKQRTVEECDDGCPAGVPGVCEPVVDDADESCSFDCRRLRPSHCGNGVSEGSEVCDDGNNDDSDDCTQSCQVAVCGDGFVHSNGSGTEECDDGNGAAGDGCTAACANECGNGVIDQYCSQPSGSAGQVCSIDADCDSAPLAGDGLCITGEDCDTGTANLCVDDMMSPICSNACRFKSCGNDAQECEEECDLGPENAVPGSGCTAACKRNLAEKPGTKECPAAFTVDSAPQPLPSTKQTCVDGNPACDFDGVVNGECVFRIGVCLNRVLNPDICLRDELRTFDLLGVKIRGKCVAGHVGGKCVTDADCDLSSGSGDGECLLSRAVAAARTLTTAIVDEVGAGASVPNRCRAGLKGKVCSVDEECDRAFGLGDGICDIGTGVQFNDPTLAATDTACTPGQDIVLDAGTKLNLKSYVRRQSGRADKDRLTLVCSEP